MNQSNNGFTLIELLMTLSIIWITFGIALPSFNELLDRKKVSANVERLTQVLQLSRTRAIVDNVKVTLCPINGNLSCSNDWSTGYMSFVDYDGDRQYRNNDQLLFQYFSQDKKFTLNWKAFGDRRSLQWLETGITNHQNGSFEWCHVQKANHSRALFLTKTGRIRFSKDTNGDNIHENVIGANISC